MTVAIALTGGDAHGAWFEDHKLEGAPETVRVGVAIDGTISLLDLPDDTLELGEREIIYRRQSVGIMCERGRGHRCGHFATYVPDGLEQDPLASRAMRRQLLEDAGLQPPLRLQR